MGWYSCSDLICDDVGYLSKLKYFKYPTPNYAFNAEKNSHPASSYYTWSCVHESSHLSSISEKAPLKSRPFLCWIRTSLSSNLQEDSIHYFLSVCVCFHRVGASIMVPGGYQYMSYPWRALRLHYQYHPHYQPHTSCCAQTASISLIAIRRTYCASSCLCLPTLYLSLIKYTPDCLLP